MASNQDPVANNFVMLFLKGIDDLCEITGLDEFVIWSRPVMASGAIHLELFGWLLSGFGLCKRYASKLELDRLIRQMWWFELCTLNMLIPNICSYFEIIASKIGIASRMNGRNRELSDHRTRKESAAEEVNSVTDQIWCNRDLRGCSREGIHGDWRNHVVCWIN